MTTNVTDDGFGAKPQPITEAEFLEQLNILPPMGWAIVNGVEGFTSPEPYDFNTHWRFIRIGAQCWKILASPRLTITELAVQCRRTQGN